jgi:hypothetical protein
LHVVCLGAACPPSAPSAVKLPTASAATPNTTVVPDTTTVFDTTVVPDRLPAQSRRLLTNPQAPRHRYRLAWCAAPSRDEAASRLCAFGHRRVASADFCTWSAWVPPARRRRRRR